MPPVARVDDPADVIAALAARYRRANGPVMRLVTKLGGSLESQMALVPASMREQMERTVARALEASLRPCGPVAPDLGES
ncbi:MAG: staphylolytic protease PREPROENZYME LASA, partial [Rhodobacteraceae bacterium]|nr:staphylolytic protease PREPROENZYME LASA [Paracoccaceae bacterium]